MFVDVGVEKHVFKCMSVGLRGEFTGVTSCLPFPGLIAFFLPGPHTAFPLAGWKAVIDGRVTARSTRARGK